MQNLFEQFAGADLDRLTDCLQAIRRAGLTVDKYTQAGINHNSGNVWVWGECWSGSVYSDLAGNVRWSYFCHECGEEYSFETYQELEDYASEYEHSACQSCKTETEQVEA